MQATIRITRKHWNVLEHIQDGEKEGLAYLLAKKVQTDTKILLLIQEVFVGSSADLEQTTVSVTANPEFMAKAYGLAFKNNWILIDVHTHPFGSPSFSKTDAEQGQINKEELASLGLEMGMLVFNPSWEFSGVFHSLDRSFQISDIEILGEKISFLPEPEKHSNDQYTRHDLIELWNQEKTAHTSIAILGVGGTGSKSNQELTSLGVAEKAAMILIDPDRLEASNIPRIGYVKKRDIGKNKALLGKRHAKWKNKKRKVIAKQVPLKQAEGEIVECHCIFCCVDTDGARLPANEIAIRYLIPLIDISSEIILVEGQPQYLCMARTVIPGKTGCLVCSGGLDHSEKDPYDLTEQDRQSLKRTGYLRDFEAVETPSVSFLNSVVASFGVSIFSRMLLGQEIPSLVHFNLSTWAITTVSTPRREECPVCGKDGVLGAGR